MTSKFFPSGMLDAQLVEERMVDRRPRSFKHLTTQVARGERVNAVEGILNVCQVVSEESDG